MHLMYLVKNPLKRTSLIWMDYAVLLSYIFCWNIEVSCYEKKIFLLLCHYMVRSSHAINLVVNLVNYSMKILPYSDIYFKNNINESMQ